jgi:RDD family
MSPSRTAQRRSSRGHFEDRVPSLRAPLASENARLRAFFLTCLLFVATLGVGWMAWSIVEWRHGRTVSYRLLGLRVVRRGDARPVGFIRSFFRNGVLCTVLLIPTIIACVLLAVVFFMGASPPDDLLTKARSAPWDLLTRTEVLDERSQIAGLTIFTPATIAHNRVDMN